MTAARSAFDTVVVGGGVYGILLALEGAARGRKLLLVERNDLGGGASFNHLRTIHGGLRYLQSLALARAVRSNAQRLWWLEHFPDLVEPIRCLMPLYGRGLRRPVTFRLAFALAKPLGMQRDAAGRRARFEVIGPAEVRALLPVARSQGLLGGAVWQDAFMPRPHRVVAELARWAEQAGATLRNYTELTAAERSRNGGWRITLREHRTESTREVDAQTIVNAAASDSDEVIARVAGRRVARVMIPTLGWNLLLDRPPPADCSVAVSPPGRRTTWFVHPFQGRTLAGTGHAAVPPGSALPGRVPRELLQGMLDELNAALPGADFAPDAVCHEFLGVIPGSREGSSELLKQHRIVDHARRDGVPGLWTVLGVKFTEAPFVAREYWDRRLGPRPGPLPERPEPALVPTLPEARGMSDEALRAVLERVAHSEWQADGDDLAWRRTDLWMDEEQKARVERLVARPGAPEV